MSEGDAALIYLGEFVKQRAGLIIGLDKTYLWQSRLRGLMQRFALADFDALAARLRGGDPALATAVVESMTTHETLFFRDMGPFNHFRKVGLPHFSETRSHVRTLRIWSAACSSGQEPYSLAMILLEEQAKLTGWRFEIIATDVSEGVLQKAREARFSHFEVQRGLPSLYLAKYFEKDGDSWRLKPAVRDMVTFQPFNLLDDPRSLGRFDVVFCRNVLIYFDFPTKGAVLDRIGQAMAADGMLYLGGVETVYGVTDRFGPLGDQRGVYGLVNTSAKAASAA